MGDHAPITVEIVEDGDKRCEVLQFINKKYLEVFETTPPATQVIVAARCGSEIVGTLGLDSCDEDGFLRLEKIYRFDHSRTPFPVERDLIVQYTRWIATTPGASVGLAYLGTFYAYERGKRYGWFEHAHHVHRAAMRLGITFHAVRDAILLIDRIPEHQRAFYAAPPPLELYMASLLEIKESLRPQAERLTAEGKLVFPAL